MPTLAFTDTGVISGTFIQLLLAYLRSLGHNGERLLQLPAPPPATGLYPLKDWRALLARAADHLHDPLLGLHLGQFLRIHHLGTLGFVLHSCGTVGGALQRFQHYERLFYAMEPMRQSIEEGDLVLSWSRQPGPGAALAEQCLLASLIQCTRDLSGQPLTPSLMGFPHGPCGPEAEYAAFSGAPVLFHQPRLLLRLPLKLLATPLLHPDAALLEVLEEQTQGLLARAPDLSDHGYIIRCHIAQQLRDGHTSLASVATAMNLSPRTLRRRLEARQTSFRLLLEDTRARLAEEYLADPRLQLSDVAALLGYAEQSPFQRAFRRWTGTTPQAWRRAHDQT